MHIEEIRTYCIQLSHVTEHFPFDSSTLVFKVGNKMFSLIDVDHAEFINLKNDPELNIELRERYDGIRPGYHMHKAHWNSVYLNEDVPREKILALIQTSYELILNSLPKKVRNELSI